MKLASIIELTNESVGDASFNLAQAIGNAIRQSMGPILDSGLLYGDGNPPNPTGLVPVAPPAALGTAGDLRSGIIQAWGEITSAGAPPDRTVCFISPGDLANEWSKLSPVGTPFTTTPARPATCSSVPASG